MRKTGFFCLVFVQAGLLLTAKEAGAEEQKIRVLLMDTDYRTYCHEEAVICLGKERMSYTADSPELGDEPLVLADDGGGICVESISRQGEAPVYAGTLEIHVGEGGLFLINELPLETYLEAVVPSEMPSDYGLEALKAQAVCARTYACRQMETQSLSQYGADVDDSVNFQVYRNVPPQESTSRAVRETAGQVLTCQGELIEAYYFSTSSGKTSTDEVWGVQEVSAYLKSVPCDFDVGAPWSVWETTLPWETLDARARELPGCAGELHYLAPMKRSESGAIVSLCVYTEEGISILESEYDVREFLAPEGLVVEGKDGAEMKGGALLPSAYITMEVTPREKVCISGKGYGHGVGMSQSAADVMAQEGYTYEEILHYFFENVELTADWR